MNQSRYKEFIKMIRTIQNENERRIDKLYLNELDALRQQISKMYEDYGEDGSVTLEGVEKYGYLKSLEDSFVERIKVLSRQQELITKEAITTSFTESYYYRGFAIESVAAMSIFTLLSPQVANSFVFNDLLAVKWNESINDDNNALIKSIKSTIRTALVQGDDYRKTIDNVKERINVGKNKALQIIQEETHRASEDANLKVMQDAKDKGVIMKKRWISTLDSRTRKTHQHLDGQTIEVDEYFISKGGRKAQAPKKFGDPKEDINCRCTTIAVFEGLEPEVRKARDTQNKGEIIKYKNYNEWKQRLK
ncbi:phage head morphogenesis protein [Lysinibacillus sp. FSL M8-0355]|uniref:phage head morphogenesis protein n=1 Tax=Lysinibacillus sp. FSL M8-0355 TaxID=2921719 RepID=UPI0030F50EED